MKEWIEVTISDNGKKAMVFVPYISAFYPVFEFGFQVVIHAAAAKIYAYETYEEVVAKIAEANAFLNPPKMFAHKVMRFG